MKEIKRIIVLLLAVVVIGSMTACQSTKETVKEGTELQTEEPNSSDSQDTLFIEPEDYPRVDGSTATIPLSLATYMALTKATTEEAESAIVHTKTAGSYQRLLNNEVDLLIVYSAPESIQEEIKNSSTKLNIKPIGKDALVFITNDKNPVKGLTTEQLIDIYSGKTTNWSELGGKDQSIMAFQRPEDSGSQALMQSLVMKEVKMVAAPIYQQPSAMGELIDRIVEYNNEANALGYSVYYYAKNMYEQPGLKFLDIDGVAPNNDTIQKGTYPHVKDFYAVIREDEGIESPAYKVFDWLTSEAGQKLVQDTGYVSIK